MEGKPRRLQRGHVQLMVAATPLPCVPINNTTRQMPLGRIPGANQLTDDAELESVL